MSQLTIGQKIFDTNVFWDLSIGLGFQDSVKAFGAPIAEKKPFISGSFTGDTLQGGSCNCDQVTFIPHCHMTHTECVGHLTETDNFVPDLIDPFLGMVRLMTVTPENNEIGAKFFENLVIDDQTKALIIRTLPNSEEKKHIEYKDQAPFLSAEAMKLIAQTSIKHLLVDFPSVDAMDDQNLTAHRIFWNLETGQKEITESVHLHRSITELIYVDSVIEDGQYLLQLQFANMQLDGVPARPLLYKEV